MRNFFAQWVCIMRALCATIIALFLMCVHCVRITRQCSVLCVNEYTYCTVKLLCTMIFYEKLWCARNAHNACIIIACVAHAMYVAHALRTLLMHCVRNSCICEQWFEQWLYTMHVLHAIIVCITCLCTQWLLTIIAHKLRIVCTMCAMRAYCVHSTVFNKKFIAHKSLTA